MSDLPLDLRRKLEKEYSLSVLKIARVRRSKDGTEKFLLELGDDGNLIECVSIPSGNRVTGCVSSQAGCKFSCSFCASALGGFKRNLTTGEIISQVLTLKNNSTAGKLTHIVFMGSGEPLDNYDNVLKAIRIINSKEGFNIGARRITVSTCGIIPGIKKLAQEDLQIELSVSLHAADDKTRSRIVPINKKYPLKDLFACLKGYIKETNRQVTFEYILINGLNSDLQNAFNLSKMLTGLGLVKINLIAANPVKECGVMPPDKKEILAFKGQLLKEGIPVTLRVSRGSDIEAACGQLRLKYAKD